MKTARLAWWLSGLAALAAVVYLMATASTGPVDPTEVAHPQSNATVLFNSSMIVFREGLEAVLIFAAVTSSFVGANRIRRRPVVAGAAVAFAAAVATWFAVDALLALASSLGARLEAITGFIAIVVLVVVLNWFVHHVYWTGWMDAHHRQRRRLLGMVGLSAAAGLVALGFTSVYREGFEVVLFLQALKVKSGSGVVLEGRILGLIGTAAVGTVIFGLQRKLPYRRMLVLTGVLVGCVLVVMTGGTALSFQGLGWLPNHPTPFTLPAWMGAWFEMYSSWETLACQLFAALFVVGSYVLAEQVKVRRPQRRGEAPSARAGAPPAAARPEQMPALTR